MTSTVFTYDKRKVIQALRYHFISRPEIKVLLIVVNVFAILAAALFYLHYVRPLPFLLSSVLWFILMVTFWYLLPRMIYRRAETFRDSFRAILTEQSFRIENDRGGRSWEWSAFSSWYESPFFFHLYFDSRSFFLVPKDAFEGDMENEARKMLRGHIKKS